MEILLYTIVFLLLLVVSNVTNRLLPQLPLPLVQIVLGISLGFLLPSGEISFRYRAIFGLGNRTLALSGG